MPPQKHAKLGSSIVQLLEAAQSVPDGEAVTNASLYETHSPVQAYMDAGLLHLDDLGRLQVRIKASSTDSELLSELGSWGVVIEGRDESRNLLQSRVPVEYLAEVAELSNVRSVTPPKYGYVNAGSALTEGDALLDFDDLRSSFGVSGSGITLGVISDGIFGLADAIASGDLPATSLNRDGNGKLVSTTGGVIATSFRADADLESGLGSTGAEGTAILEIIHDIAPNAQLRFANFGTALEFITAVDFLAANSDVVIDDIGFFGKPYDQTSDVSTNTSEELNRSSNPIRGYYTSVGNQALAHYEEGFVSGGQWFPDGSTYQQFNSSSDTTDALGLSNHFSNPVLVPNGGIVAVFLSWDDVFGSATSDYDLFLYDNVNSLLVAVGGDDNTVTGEPTEFLAFENLTGSTRYFDIVVTNFEGTQPAHTLELFTFGGATLANGTSLNFNTARSSVSAQSDSGGGVVSVGAINASDAGADDIATYSSRGPTNNGVTKPDVTAIDEVTVTGSGGFGSPFSGTSAAAPHVAGLAVLLLELAPDLTSGEPGDDPAADRVALRTAVLNGAVDLGVSGVDNTYGYGRVNGTASRLALLPGSPTNVSAVAGDSRAVVSWSAPASDGGSAIVQYTATSSPGGLTTMVDGSTLSATVAGLTDGTAYTFVVTATNDVGTSDPSAPSNSVTPTNLPPAVQAAADLAANEGVTPSLQLATFTDAGSRDTHTAGIDWGDESLSDAGVVDQEADTVSGSHNYADNGTYTVTVTVTDNDGASDSESLTLTVNNLAPVVDAGEDLEVRVGLPMNLGATFTDAASADTHGSSIDWGDGSPAEAGALDQTADTITGTHTYITGDNYALTVMVTDDDGGSSSDTITVVALPGVTVWGLTALGGLFGLLMFLRVRRRSSEGV